MFRRQLHDRLMSVAVAALLLSSCARLGPEDVSDSAGMTVGEGKPVPAAAETPAVGTGDRDAADDPEIWVDPKDPSRGVIIGTDKQAGLYVYDLTGKQLQYVPGGKPNNVDLRDGFPTAQGARVLVAASDRGRPARAPGSSCRASPAAPCAPSRRCSACRCPCRTPRWPP